MSQDETRLVHALLSFLQARVFLYPTASPCPPRGGSGRAWPSRRPGPQRTWLQKPAQQRFCCVRPLFVQRSALRFWFVVCGGPRVPRLDRSLLECKAEEQGWAKLHALIVLRSCCLRGCVYLALPPTQNGLLAVPNRFFRSLRFDADRAWRKKS